MERMINHEERMALRIMKEAVKQSEIFNAQLEIEDSQWDLSNLNKAA
jgi:hypothetical protein